MRVWLHQEYRQFTLLRQPGEIINVREKVGLGLVARGAACPMVDGIHQCQVVGVPPPTPEYLDEQLDAPVNEMMLPTKWSGKRQNQMRAAMRRSPEVRRALRGKDLRDIPVGRLR